MAQRLGSYAFPLRGNIRKYPWDDWTDGSIWKVEEGVDFNCNPHSFGVSAYATARRDHLDVKVSVDKKQGTVVFQFSRKEASNGSTT